MIGIESHIILAKLEGKMFFKSNSGITAATIENDLQNGLHVFMQKESNKELTRALTTQLCVLEEASKER